VVRVDGQPLEGHMPTKVYIPGWFGVPSNELTLGRDKIMISDFGESFNPQTLSKRFSKTLPLLQPPETRFSDEPLSFPFDIWTLTCTIWEILGHRPLLEAYFASAGRVTKEQVEVFGKLPPEWWGNWSKRLDWFNEEGELKLSSEGPGFQDVVRRTLDVRFEHNIQKSRIEAGLEVMADKEKRAFQTMLRSMLRFQPKVRATAQQAMQSEWMLDWGLPALEEGGRVSGSAGN
jgi:serine/threonine-protein kinase SRPK3